MSLWELFRLVRFHGGKYPYLSWHPEGSLPIVVMAPNVKLTEGADFAFGARWALMQYHTWHDRRQYLDMSDDEVKRVFREWRQRPECPWYVKDQYLSDNGRRAQGGAGPVGATASTGTVAGALPEAEYKSRM